MGRDGSIDQSVDCSVSSSTFWGQMNMSGTPLEGYQKVRRSRLVIWGPVTVLVKGNTTKCGRTEATTWWNRLALKSLSTELLNLCVLTGYKMNLGYIICSMSIKALLFSVHFLAHLVFYFMFYIQLYSFTIQTTHFFQTVIEKCTIYTHNRSSSWLSFTWSQPGIALQEYQTH